MFTSSSLSLWAKSIFCRHSLPRLTTLVALGCALVTADAAHAFLEARTVVRTTALAPLPVATDGAAGFATSGAIFVAGGESARGLSSTLYRIDGRTGAATVVTDRLVARRDHQAVLLDEDTVLLLGGRSRRGVDAAVEIVRLDDGLVSRRAPMPTPRAGLGAALVNGVVVTAGGSIGWGKTNTVELYDVKADRWLRAPPLSQARDGVLVNVDGLVYALGGGGDKGATSVVERFDGRRFVVASPLPRAMRDHGAAALGSRVLLLGDASDPRQLTLFDPISRKSETLRSAHTARTGAATVSLGDRVVLLGGRVDGRPSNVVEMLTFE
jgi:hypothetical protein